MSAADARRAVLTLASHTGWGLNELLDLDGEEVNEWLRAVQLLKARK